MADHVAFETPENITIRYQLAGLGSRFLAWLADSIIFSLLLFVICIFLLLAGCASEKLTQEIVQPFTKIKPGEMPQFPLYLVGLFMLAIGLGNFIYFGLSELIWSGQTIGKKQLHLRAVKADGFSLDATSIFLRNIFRVIDHIPAFWIIPLLSAKSQRLGDMVGGTVIIVDEPSTINRLREHFLARPAGDSLFRFDSPTLAKLRPVDFESVERLLERWPEINEVKREELLHLICDSLCKRLDRAAPDHDQRLRFLEDLLTAEYRRQYRELG